jgi:TolA-binding protein
MKLPLTSLAFALALSLAANGPANAQPRPASAAPVPQSVSVPPAIEPLSARMIIRLEQVERQQAELIGRIEVLEADLVTAKADNQRLAGLLDSQRASALTSAAAAPEVAMETAKEVPAAATDETAMPAQSNVAQTDAAAPAPVATATPSPVTSPAPAAAPSVGATPKVVAIAVAATAKPSAEALLSAAQNSLQRADFSDAESKLTTLVTDYSQTPQALEGRWLLGEARFVQAAWRPAAQAYIEYLSAAPTGPRSNEALVRLAGAFRELGDLRQSCTAMAEFRRRAPRPDPTLKARADAEAARTQCPST